MRDGRRIGLGVLLAGLVASEALAVTATPVFVQTPRLGRIQLLNGTGAYAIASGGATVSGTLAAYTCTVAAKITGMIAAGNDTVARDLTVFMVPASNIPYILTTVTVPITAGQVAGTPPVNLLSQANTPGLPVDSDGNPFLLCEAGDVIRVGVKVAVSATLLISVLTVAQDF